MKRNMQKTLLMLMVVMLLAISTTVPAFAADTTTTGTGEVPATIPINGTVESLLVSVTHPLSVAYVIDPNADPGYTFICPDIVITNNTKVDISVAINSFEAVSGGQTIFTDVAPDYCVWEDASSSVSNSYIALGIAIKDTLFWITPTENIHYAVDGYGYLGNLDSGATGELEIVAHHGFAFMQVTTAKHSLVLNFMIV